MLSLPTRLDSAKRAFSLVAAQWATSLTFNRYCDMEVHLAGEAAPAVCQDAVCTSCTSDHQQSYHVVAWHKSSIFTFAATLLIERIWRIWWWTYIVTSDFGYFSLKRVMLTTQSIIAKNLMIQSNKDIVVPWIGYLHTMVQSSVPSSWPSTLILGR